jgi:hypothetical protein
MKRKEIAKFFCGFEVFHTLSHTYFLVSGTTLTIFGITVTPVISGISAVVNGIIAILLGVYAWKRPNPGGSMSQIPRDKLPESTLALLLDPYRFVSKRCRLYQTDLFQARLMFENTICMKGHEAAELFYNEDHFIRGGVAPGWLKKTLFGVGGVQGLDGEAHRHRKQMFMSLMDPERIKRLGEITANYFHTYAEKWMKKESITLYD